jgi:hypothetical protein
MGLANETWPGRGRNRAKTWREEIIVLNIAHIRCFGVYCSRIFTRNRGLAQISLIQIKVDARQTS